MARTEASSVCRQLFANVFADCFCALHTKHLEFGNFSLPCEGRLRTFARNFSNIDICLKIFPLKDDELAMSEM